LGVKHRFPALLAGEPFLTSKVAKAVCHKLASEVLTTVPQLDDYLCPVCFGIAYKPVRLSCGHIFCIRCMVTMQRSRETHCPLCRGDVVMAADSSAYLSLIPPTALLVHPCLGSPSLSFPIADTDSSCRF
jgi:hypothetical protein